MAQIKAEYVNHMGDDLTTVNAARVSFGKESEYECTDLTIGTYELKNKDKKLISYLAKHKHFSPFGHCFASFRVKAPIFVARQLVKHQYLRWNEISRRYVDDEPEFYTPDVWRGRAEDKKQGSGGTVNSEAAMYDFPYYGIEQPLALYKKLLQEGVAPEQARMVLPQNTMTEWWWSGSLDAFADMVNLRDKDDTQYETRLVAVDINREMTKLFPYSWKALTS